MFDLLSEAQWLGGILYAGAVALLLIGGFIIVTRRDLFRVLLGLAVLEGGVNLFLVAAGFRPEAVAPILAGQAPGLSMVDPVPQALVLTAIVIGVAVLALGLALLMRVHARLGTTDTKVLTELLSEKQMLAELAGRGGPIQTDGHRKETRP